MAHVSSVEDPELNWLRGHRSTKAKWTKMIFHSFDESKIFSLTLKISS
jgi:hypothetical protein